MNKIVLSLILTITISVGYTQVSPTVGSDCGPNPLYADSSLGVWPDTITNLPCTKPNVDYKAILQLKLPLDAGDIDTLLSGNNIIGAWVDNVVGLPSGMAIFVNAATWPGGGQGCAYIRGATASVGVHNITINTKAEIDLGGVSTIVDRPFSGYKLEVSATCTTTPFSVPELSANGFVVSQNVPNPASSKTTFKLESIKNGSIDFKVYNLLGEVMEQRKVAVSHGDNWIEINTADYAEGIYSYTIDMDGTRQSKKMIVNR